METIHYRISEAVKSVGVNSHTLRYWEDELHLIIGRTQMGHRYYTKDDIQLFHCINKLKDIGVTMKELKELIPEIQTAKREYIKKGKREQLLAGSSTSNDLFIPAFPELDDIQQATIIPLPKREEDLTYKEEKRIKKYKPQYVKFQVKDIKKQRIQLEPRLVDQEVIMDLKHALQSNNVVLTEAVCKAVTASLKKEISYMLDAKELIEEEHFRKLDETIRSVQQERKNQVKKGLKFRIRNVLGYE